MSDEKTIILSGPDPNGEAKKVEEKPLRRYSASVVFIKQWNDEHGVGQLEWKHPITNDVFSEDVAGAEWLAERMFRGDAQMGVTQEYQTLSTTALEIKDVTPEPPKIEL